MEREGLTRIAVGGGVAANGELRARVEKLATDQGGSAHIPAMSLCTDNAAMIGGAARYATPLAPADYLGLDAYARAA